MIDATAPPQPKRVPSLVWYVGGTDPGVYHRAAQAGRIAEDVPTNHSSKLAPVLHPHPRNRH